MATLKARARRAAPLGRCNQIAGNTEIQLKLTALNQNVTQELC